MLKYQTLNTNQTLKEGIAELRAFVGPDHDSAIKMGLDMENTMKAHDAVHVVFGCDTSMEDEALSHFVMFLATDVKISDVKKVAKSTEHKAVVGEHSKSQIFTVLLGAPVDLINVLRLVRKMHKKWSWFGYEKYLDLQIKEIRNEFGIAPITRAKNLHRG